VNTIPGSLNAFNDLDTAITGLAVNDPDAVSLTTSLHIEHGILNVAAVSGGAAVAGSGTSTGAVDFRNGELVVRDWRRLAEIGQFNPRYLHLKKPPL
jgi:hypothetical protein